MKNIDDSAFSPNSPPKSKNDSHETVHSAATLFFLVITLLLLSGCAMHYTQEAYSDPYGFFSGIWHGVIFPYALIVNIISWFLSLLGIEFLSNTQIIGRPNAGFFFYYIGFLLGLSAYGSARAR